MTIQEAIKHCYDVADGCENTMCSQDHIQLAHWLEQLEQIKQKIADYNKLLIPIQDYIRKNILINDIEDILKG